MVCFYPIYLFQDFRFQPTMDPSNQTLNDANLNISEIFSYLNYFVKLIVNPALGLVSIVLNIINMIVFYKMGLSDGVTQNFFILSLCDCLTAVTSLVNSIAHMARTIVRSFIGYGGLEQVVHILYMGSHFSLPFPQNYSLITTVVIAVVRCCCVAMPLKVKHLITVKRQLVAILFLSGMVTSILVYVYAPLKMFHVLNLATNTTEAYFLGARWQANTIFNNILCFGSFIICITCVIILSTSLNKASRFRDSFTTSTSISTSYGNTSDSDKKSKEILRNARAVRTVVLVCVIFIVCNVPHMVLYLLMAYLEGFGPGGKYYLARVFSISVAEMFLLISTCLNTFIYILYNTRYGDIFFSLFQKKRDDSSAQRKVMSSEIQI